MSQIKEIDIKNRTYYFFDDMLNIKTIKNFSYINFNSVNHVYLIIDKVDGYIEKNNGNKYLTLVSTDKNKETLKKYTKLWDKIKDLIRPVTNTSDDYDEKYKKIKFNSGNNLPLNKVLKLHNLTMVDRYVFQEDKKYHKFS